jgi:hypothetical protein
MTATRLNITDDRFLINDTPVYSDIDNADPAVHGLLMNARFIQGIFDEADSPEFYARFGKAHWDPEENTDALIAALPQWYRYGLRAFTVGFQGGGPCFTTDITKVHNNPFGDDGRTLDPAYARRMDKLIRAADEIGMVVIVSYFYHAQAARITDGTGIRNAITTASRFLREGGYTNVLIEVANEYTVGRFCKHPIINTPEGCAMLIDLARAESGGLPTGCSGGGGEAHREVIEHSDVALIHGNGQCRTQYYNLIERVREWNPRVPIVCNEDSQAIGQLAVAFSTHTSWGYYNNMTKQEPPADWGITPGEDTFFALRMAMGLGIPVDLPPRQRQFYLQGLEPHHIIGDRCWPRVASLHPESVDHVDYFYDGKKIYTSWDEPFSVKFNSNWHQSPTEGKTDPAKWKAEVVLCNKDSLTLTAKQ